MPLIAEYISRRLPFFTCLVCFPFGGGQTIESRRDQVPKLAPFLVPFLNRFVEHLFQSLGALQMPLGSLLGPSEAVLDGFGPQDPKDYEQL